jgi:phospho-N-acetylmuramoyl-pentapeptide-transferase
MLYAFLLPLAGYIHAFNLFRYITFRAGGACLTALVISFWAGPKVIRYLKSVQRHGQPIRSDGPERHLIEKKGTPTIGYGGIGFADDYLKLTRRNTKGVSGWVKLVAQAGIGLVAAVWMLALMPAPLGTELALPMLKNVLIPFGIFFPLVAMFVLMGASNSVNLTDGLDGLAIVPTMIAAAVFALIAYLVGNKIFSGYLEINFIPGAGELTVFLSALMGAGLGFLWFNAPPAAVFMGDTGSLSLGGALGAAAVVTKNEIVLAIVGGLFVVETVSVIVQVFWFKRTGRRVFLMAPLHHHFEKKGWAEPTIVIRFWIIAMILALVGLATLKIR